MDKPTLFFHANNNYFLGCKNLISFDMKEDEYKEAIRDGCYGALSKNGRIIIHEYAHWVQSAGTPYGFYLELVHHYENELLRQLEELIASRLYKGNQIKVSPPFKKYIEDKLFYNIQDKKLWELFECWIDLFFLHILTCQRRDLYYDTIKQYKNFFASYPQCRYTEDIENYIFLPHLFNRADRFLDCRLSEFIGREILHRDIKRDELYSRKNISAAMASGVNGYSLQITHHSLWESYATVVEYIDVPEAFEFPSRVNAVGTKKAWNEYYDPLRYLEIYLPAAKYDKLLFLKSCICVFDIVFSPPILPQCVLLRESKISVFDFDIVSRFYAVAETASHVGSLSNYQSVGEYMTAICRALKWYTPDEVFLRILRCWDSLNIIPSGKMFQYFIIMRMTGEYLPFNRLRFLCEVLAEHVRPCFLKLKDALITNPCFSYGLSLDAQMELYMISAALGMDVLFPEALKYDYEYYQYYLLRELVQKLWERNDKMITLVIPATCSCIENVESYLQSWIDDNHIDVQLNFEYI